MTTTGTGDWAMIADDFAAEKCRVGSWAYSVECLLQFCISTQHWLLLIEDAPGHVCLFVRFRFSQARTPASHLLGTRPFLRNITWVAQWSIPVWAAI
jgi:hypothetical protein